MYIDVLLIDGERKGDVVHVIAQGGCPPTAIFMKPSTIKRDPKAKANHGQHLYYTRPVIENGRVVSWEATVQTPR